MLRVRQLLILLPALLGSLSAWADDPVVISVEDVRLAEGSGHTTDMVFTVTLSGAASATVSVAYATASCTATEGEDYVGVNGVLVFSEATVQEVEVPVIGDDDAEGTESFVLRLFDADGAVLGRDRALGFVVNDDAPRFQAPRARGDADGDGRSDLVVSYERNLKNGQPSGKEVIWGIDGQTATQQQSSPPTPVAEGWRVAATADVDADGLQDLIWYHPAAGLAFSTLLEGGFSEPDLDAPELIPADTPATATIVGTGDFSGDGGPDLLTWDPVSGALSIWVLDGKRIAGTATPEPAAADSGQWPLAVGDLDGDGASDVLWLEDATHQLSVWRMAGGEAVEIVAFVPATAAPGSQVVAVGDFDGDRDEDLLWQEPSQELFVWFLEGGERVCGDYLRPRTLELAGWDTWTVDGPR